MERNNDWQTGGFFDQIAREMFDAEDRKQRIMKAYDSGDITMMEAERAANNNWYLEPQSSQISNAQMFEPPIYPAMENPLKDYNMGDFEPVDAPNTQAEVDAWQNVPAPPNTTANRTFYTGIGPDNHAANTDAGQAIWDYNKYMVAPANQLIFDAYNKNLEAANKQNMDTGLYNRIIGGLAPESHIGAKLVNPGYMAAGVSPATGGLMPMRPVMPMPQFDPSKMVKPEIYNPEFIKQEVSKSNHPQAAQGPKINYGAFHVVVLDNNRPVTSNNPWGDPYTSFKLQKASRLQTFGDIADESLTEVFDVDRLRGETGYTNGAEKDLTFDEAFQTYVYNKLKKEPNSNYNSYIERKNVGGDGLPLSTKKLISTYDPTNKEYILKGGDTDATNVAIGNLLGEFLKMGKNKNLFMGTVQPIDKRGEPISPSDMKTRVPSFARKTAVLYYLNRWGRGEASTGDVLRLSSARSLYSGRDAKYKYVQ